MRYLLTIAGSDPGGGAGLQKDLRVFQLRGFWGLSAVTGLTVQGSGGVNSVHPVAPEVLAAQLGVLVRDYPLAGIKVGALFSRDQVEVVAEFLSKCPVPKVGDPVFSPTRGEPFLDETGVEAWGQILGPQLTVATPNNPEKLLLTKGGGLDRIPGLYVTGGHGDDPLWLREDLFLGGHHYRFRHRRRPWTWTHGTGCTFSSALTTELAQGRDLPQSCRRAGLWTRVFYDKLNK